MNPKPCAPPSFPPALRRCLPALGLLGLTLAVYAQAHALGFVSFDDPDYVSQNPQIQSGLSWGTIAWAFTTHRAANWHPLTWISLALDSTFFGTGPAGYHVMNVAFHAANTLLLHHLLKRLTGRAGPSFLAAAMFAVHPLHVESVAWISERKDVLSTLFWLLTTRAYLRWVEAPHRGNQLLVAGYYGAGLLAKPMLVTLPVTLLLLDAWPLRRIPCGGGFWRAFGLRMLEKWPLFLAAAASSAITLWAQHSMGAMADLQRLPMVLRFGNATVSLAGYLHTMVWPSPLAAFYPLRPDQLEALTIGGSALVIVSLSWVCIHLRRPYPYLLVGWAWYLVTLLPVLGLVQVGSQSMADRYTYVPLIGPFAALSLGASDFLARFRIPTGVGRTLGGVVLGALSWMAFRQVSIWKDTLTLFEHAARVTQDNWLAHERLADTYLEAGRHEDSIRASSAAARIVPFRAINFTRIGDAWRALGNTEKAMSAYQGARDINPRDKRPTFALACIHAERGHLDQARALFEEVFHAHPGQLGQDPTFVHQARLHTRMSLGFIHRSAGDLEASNRMFDEALQVEPNHLGAYLTRALNLAQQGRARDALKGLAQAPEGLQESPGLLLIKARLARQAGDLALSQSTYAQLLAREPQNAEAAAGARPSPASGGLPGHRSVEPTIPRSRP